MNHTGKISLVDGAKEAPRGPEIVENLSGLRPNSGGLFSSPPAHPVSEGESPLPK